MLNSTAESIPFHSDGFCESTAASIARVMLAKHANTPHTASETLADFHIDVLSVQQYVAKSAITIGTASTNDFKLKR